MKKSSNTGGSFAGSGWHPSQTIVAAARIARQTILQSILQTMALLLSGNSVEIPGSLEFRGQYLFPFTPAHRCT